MFRLASRWFPLNLCQMVGIFALVICSNSGAELQAADAIDDKRYLADIQVHTAAELESILLRAEALSSNGELDSEGPVVFVLHGSEGKVFLRERYDENKALVDLAARLSALQVVDVRVCERWMGWRRINVDELQPFIETVPSGPAEIKRLRNDENYVYF